MLIQLGEALQIEEGEAIKDKGDQYNIKHAAQHVPHDARKIVRSAGKGRCGDRSVAKMDTAWVDTTRTGVFIYIYLF
ncbi:hypothetical protein EFB08_17345 [Rufibacter latericius]|uniref:Uncharacterized protein n=2 Tax=Rufibacter latericius TaxID=2487040 RepID=A0A3M9MEZ7_9BACT|nr:hypothetical protein EFB08_17345 [Rufibacter latericius]